MVPDYPQPRNPNLDPVTVRELQIGVINGLRSEVQQLREALREACDIAWEYADIGHQNERAFERTAAKIIRLRGVGGIEPLRGVTPPAGGDSDA